MSSERKSFRVDTLFRRLRSGSAITLSRKFTDLPLKLLSCIARVFVAYSGSHPWQYFSANPCKPWIAAQIVQYGYKEQMICDDLWPEMWFSYDWGQFLSMVLEQR